MIRRSLRHVVTRSVLLVAFVCQETWALAGTTGGLTGTVVDAETSAPIAGAEVTATSPSQTATVTTDAAGHFSFLTLASGHVYGDRIEERLPIYERSRSDRLRRHGARRSLRMPKALSTIAHVTSTAAGSLVKSGTTADVYSINATDASGDGGAGRRRTHQSAYSAISTVPGAYVIPNQTGYYADRQYSRRRLRPSRLRIRRRSRQPFVRQLSVELGVFAG